MNRDYIAFWLGVIWVLFQVTSPIIGIPHGLLLTGHVLFAFNYIFLKFPLKLGNRYFGYIIDVSLVIGTTLSFGYLMLNYRTVVGRAVVGEVSMSTMILGVIGVIIVLEGTRRLLGIIFPAIGLAMFVYLFLPNTYVPIFIPLTPQVDMAQAMSQIYFSTGGILAAPILVMARYVFLFILMAAFLIESGAVNHFYSMATSLTGRMAGGGAKTAVGTSALIGSINGSAVANVVTTGSITIPLMKDTGYDNDDAAAIESLASTGGQILPPVMGTAAFIMAHIAGIPYPRIAIAAVIPALLFYIGVYSIVHFIGAREGIGTLPDEEIPAFGGSFKRGFWLFIPFVAIIGALTIWPYAIQNVALTGAVVAGIVVYISPEMDFGRDEFVEVLKTTPRMTVKATAPSALAGIILGLVTLTLVDVRLSSYISSFGGEAIILTAFLVAVTAIIMGMGMPTAGAYIVAAAVAIPGLINIGVATLPAHLFGLYFAVVSMITPPICIAVFAAAGVANSNVMRTGVKAFAYGLPAYLIPFAFLLNDDLLLGVGDPTMTVVWFPLAAAGTIAIAAGMTGYFLTPVRLPERLVLLASGLFMLFPTINTYVPVIGLVAVLFLLLFRKRDYIRDAASRTQRIKADD
ncbi:TRAP transporter permease [Natrinema soli]|uniref:TRAP transporter permease n=1 Tax=Natrinema soli TaxID=1930624 RepID=A0ABD5SL76_9EURY|nr:TRAP transporter fused permease subunit [Natrinema soli]